MDRPGGCEETVVVKAEQSAAAAAAAVAPPPTSARPMRREKGRVSGFPRWTTTTTRRRFDAQATGRQTSRALTQQPLDPELSPNHGRLPPLVDVRSAPLGSRPLSAITGDRRRPAARQGARVRPGPCSLNRRPRRAHLLSTTLDPIAAAAAPASMPCRDRNAPFQSVVKRPADTGSFPARLPAS
jgi:hypothetical protein